jgi:regulatory protein
MRKAGGILARRACSRGEMRDRLLETADAAAADAVILRLEELHLLNDPEVAYNFASDRIRLRGWGPRKVRDALVRRQISAQVADAAVERVGAEAGDRAPLESYLGRYWRTRPRPSGRAEVARLVAHLSRRGFEEGIIFEVLRREVSGDAWRAFEAE